MVNMGNVWDRTTEFLSDNAGAILPIAALAILVPQAITTLIKQPGGPINPALATCLAIVLMVPTFWGQLAITALALDPDAGRGGAQSVATRRLPQAIAATLILFVGLAVLAAPIPVALVASGVDLQALMAGDPAAGAAITPGIAGFVGLYGLAVALIAIVVSIRLSILLFAVIAAEGGIIAALRRSFAMTRGIVWKMIGVYLLFSVVFGAGYLAVTSVFGVLFKLVAPGAGPLGIGAIVVAIVGGLLTACYYALVAGFSAKLYLAAVAAREGSAPRA
jgi:hypothetical protein